jgi:hypothetical protein
MMGSYRLAMEPPSIGIESEATGHPFQIAGPANSLLTREFSERTGLRTPLQRIAHYAFHEKIADIPGFVIGTAQR